MVKALISHGVPSAIEAHAHVAAPDDPLRLTPHHQASAIANAAISICMATVAR